MPLPLSFGHVSSSIAKRVLCRPFVLCVFKFGVHVARSLALVAVVLLAPVPGVSRFCLPCAPFPALLINRWLNRLRRHRRRRMAPPTMAPSAAAPALRTAGTRYPRDLLHSPTPACLRTLATANMRALTRPRCRQVRAARLAGQRRPRVRAARRRSPARRLLVRTSERSSVALCLQR